MKQKKTILSPRQSNTNEYINIIRKIINEIGYETIENPLSLRDRHTISIANFNWYENITPRKTRIKALINITVKIMYIYYLKYFCKVKIIYTLHNKTTHSKKYRKYSQILMRQLCLRSDMIVILSSDTLNYLQLLFGSKYDKQISGKTFHIPHPNYIGVYPECREEIFDIPQDDKMNILYMGYIRPYKNIEILIQLANRTKDLKIRFIVAGGCMNEAEQPYFDQTCAKMKEVPNILLYPKVIPDESLSYFIRKSDILILPYNIESSLNSGTCLLAFSYGRNVICPQIGTIRDYPLEYTYSYCYSDPTEHLNMLYQTVLKAYDDFINHKEIFDKKQQEICQLVYTQNSYENIKNKYKELYDFLYQGI